MEEGYDWQIYRGRVDFYDTKFTRPIPEEQQDELFTKEVRDLFKATHWKIYSNNYEYQLWPRIINIIKECPAVQFNLGQLSRKTIMRQIQHISFVNLKDLRLNFNQIKNIEAIKSIDAPLLQKLDLSSNKIVSIKPLRTAIFEYLRSIKLYSNLIKDYSPLMEMQTSKCFTSFHFEEYYDEVVVNQNLTWLFKVQAVKLLTLNLCNKHAINQQKMMKMLPQRFIQIQYFNKLRHIDDVSDEEDSD